MPSLKKSHRIAHVDLKGMPPTSRRLLQLPELFASLGITGLLMEWEDTFPYRHFPQMKAPYTYSLRTVREFLGRCDRAGLTIIPLIQTFGHLESLLGCKEHRYLRERPDNSSCLCPLHEDAGKVIGRLIDDVMEVHRPFGLTHFHLGADEVWTLGNCPRCRAFVAKHDKAGLFLHHLNPLVDQVNAAGARAIIWHDMLRDRPKRMVKPLVGRADLMFWCYSPDPKTTFDFASPRDMKRYGAAGVRCWGAAAYKGGGGTNRTVPDLRNRSENTRLWAEAAKEYDLEGVVLTAWSRYATLTGCCEPIEGAWESLALCARVLKKGTCSFDADVKAARRLLFGTDDLESRPPKHNRSAWRAGRAARQLHQWGGRIDWATSWAGFSVPKVWGENRINPEQVHNAIRDVRRELRRFDEIAEEFRKAFKGLVIDDEVRHFLNSRIIPRRKLWRAMEEELRKHS